MDATVDAAQDVVDKSEEPIEQLQEEIDDLRSRLQVAEQAREAAEQARDAAEQACDRSAFAGPSSENDSSAPRRLSAASVRRLSSEALPAGSTAALCVAAVPTLGVIEKAQETAEMLPALRPDVIQSGLRALLNASQITDAGLRAGFGRSVEPGEIEAHILREMEAHAPQLPNAAERDSSLTARRSPYDSGYTKKVCAGVAAGLAAGVATGGVALAAGASTVIATGVASGATGLLAAKKVEEANLLHSRHHDKAFVCSRCWPDRAETPFLPLRVVKHFYFAKLAYEDDREQQLRRLFEVFEEAPLSAGSASSTNTKHGTVSQERPWFWQGPPAEGERSKWYIALSPQGVLHIVVRGSQNIVDWYRNFSAMMESESTVYHQYSRRESMLPNLGGADLSFHRGFWEHSKTIAAEMEHCFTSACAAHQGKDRESVTDEELAHFLKENIGSRAESVEITGHSLGGAVALILHRVWNNPNGKRFKVLRFMLERFKPQVEICDVPSGSAKFLKKHQTYKSVSPHPCLNTVVFSAPPIFAAKSDKADAVQEWLWNGMKRFQNDIEREELDQFKNAQLVFFNKDPVPRLGFLVTNHQLVHAPISSVLWLREGVPKTDATRQDANCPQEEVIIKMRSIFPVPPKVQREYFSGTEGLRAAGIASSTGPFQDHILDTFEDFVLKLAPGPIQNGLGAVETSAVYVSPEEFCYRLLVVSAISESAPIGLPEDES